MQQQPDLDEVREKLAEHYQQGEGTAGAQVAPVDEPQPYYAELLEDGPVTEQGGQVVFLRQADSVELMRQKAIVQPGNGLLMGSPRPLIPLDLDGAEHTKYRKLLDPLFAPKRLAPLEPSIRALANELIDGLVGREEIEAHDEFCVPLPTMIFVDMMGLPESDREQFVRWKDGTIRATGDTPEETLANLRAAGAEMSAYIGEVIQERRRTDAEGDDLLSWLMHVTMDGRPLDDEVVSDIVYLLMIAGLDTVTSSLSLMFARLAHRPELRDEIVQHPELIPNAVEELMRYEAPVANSSRLLVDDIEIDGVELTSGSYVQASWQACNLDPRVYERPLEIDFHRRAIKHTSFASGPHRCLGSHLARLEMRCALEEWHRRIPRYSLSPAHPPEFSYLGVRAAHHLPLVLHD